MAALQFSVTVWFALVIWSLLRTSGSSVPSQTHHNVSESAESKVERLGQTFRRNVRLLRESGGRLELVFLVDESSSVGATNFRSELHFIRKMLSDFPVAPEATRVALITFSSKNHVLTRVDYISVPKAHQHKCSLFNKEIPAITYRGGGTYTRGAFQRAAVSVWTCSKWVHRCVHERQRERERDKADKTRDICPFLLEDTAPTVQHEHISEAFNHCFNVWLSCLVNGFKRKCKARKKDEARMEKGLFLCIRKNTEMMPHALAWLIIGNAVHRCNNEQTSFIQSYLFPILTSMCSIRITVPEQPQHYTNEKWAIAQAIKRRWRGYGVWKWFIPLMHGVRVQSCVTLIWPFSSSHPSLHSLNFHWVHG